MSTVDKAISLLDLFSVETPEHGLTEIARRSGFDKATTRRLLVSLARHGFIEQDVGTRVGPRRLLRESHSRKADHREEGENGDDLRPHAELPWLE